MYRRCQTPGLSVIAKSRIAGRNPIRLFAGTLRDRRLRSGEGKVREKSIMRSEPTNP